MDLAYLAQRYQNTLRYYWYGDSDQRDLGDETPPEVFLQAFTPDNCVLQYETCLQWTWDPKDWVRYCYPDAKMYVMYRDHGVSAAIKWKLEEWDGWGE